MFRLAAALIVASLTLLPAAAVAQNEEAVLTVAGEIRGRDDDLVRLDLAALRKLPTEAFATSTIWSSGVLRFRGVPLRALLDAVAADGETVRAIGLDGYSVRIPVSDLGSRAPIVAFEIDGAPIPVRRKGPFWIVYPYDSQPGYQQEEAYNRSIWHLTRIEVLDD